MAAIITFLQEHWTEAVASIISLLVGGFIGRWRAWKRFADRAFYDRITVSLNYVEDGHFKIRTLLERSSMELFRRHGNGPRRHGSLLEKGPRPALGLAGQGLLGTTSTLSSMRSRERFAEGYIRREAGTGATEQTYLLFLTCENDEGAAVCQRKVPAMMIREQVLLSTIDITPQFRNEFQKARWETLRKVREELATNPETKRIRRVSICV